MCCWLDDHQVEWQGTTMWCTTAVVYSLETTDLMTFLLHDFDDVFATLVGLPSPRHHNHHIHLLPDMAFVAS
jgi:hypothetical protein